MKKLMTGAAAVAVVVMLAATFRPAPATAQIPELILRGPGSSIGVNVRDITADEAARAQLTPAAGVMIESVREGSPARQAGFEPGDIVVEFDAERVRSVRHFTRLVQETPPQRTVEAVVIRGGGRQTLKVTPEAAGEFRATIPDSLPRDLELRLEGLRRNLPGDLRLRIDPEGLLGRGRTLGVSVTPLTDQLAEYFGVSAGVLVASVAADSPAAQAGVKAGDVITAVAGRPVRSAADITAAIRSAQPGEGVDITLTRDRSTLVVKATIPQPGTPSGRRGLPI